MDKDRDAADLNYLMIILEHGHLYENAPKDSEQEMVYKLGKKTCEKVLAIIHKVKETNPYK